MAGQLHLSRKQRRRRRPRRRPARRSDRQPGAELGKTPAGSYTPYGSAKLTPAVCSVFDAMGTSKFPGDKWRPIIPDRDRLWMLSEIDPAINQAAERGVYIDTEHAGLLLQGALFHDQRAVGIRLGARRGDRAEGLCRRAVPHPHDECRPVPSRPAHSWQPRVRAVGRQTPAGHALSATPTCSNWTRGSCRRWGGRTCCCRLKFRTRSRGRRGRRSRSRGRCSIRCTATSKCRRPLVAVSIPKVWLRTGNCWVRAGELQSDGYRT